MDLNPHASPSPHSPAGATLVTHCGMATDNFSPADADAVTALLAKHGMADRYVVHQPADHELWYILAASTPLPVGGVDGTDELAGDQLLMALNDDDETTLCTPDDTVPGEFLIELLELLFEVAGRGFDRAPIEEFVMDAARKSVEMTTDSGPAWEDYCWLLRR